MAIIKKAADVGNLKQKQKLTKLLSICGKKNRVNTAGQRQDRDKIAANLEVVLLSQKRG